MPGTACNSAYTSLGMLCLPVINSLALRSDRVWNRAAATFWALRAWFSGMPFLRAATVFLMRSMLRGERFLPASAWNRQSPPPGLGMMLKSLALIAFLLLTDFFALDFLLPSASSLLDLPVTFGFSVLDLSLTSVFFALGFTVGFEGGSASINIREGSIASGA